MSFFRVCTEDALIRELRNTFRATPLRVPETRVQPLTCFALDSGKAEFRGHLKYLLQNVDDIVLGFHDSAMANMNTNKTQSVDLSFGLKILNGFLKGLNIDASPVDAALKGAREVSFSFDNSKRVYFDINEFGSVIKDVRLDVENPALGMFKSVDGPKKFMVVNSVIVSSGFTLNIDKTSDSSFEINVPLIESVVSDSEAKVDVKSDKKKAITFQGEKDLTFAFTSVELRIDWKEGKILEIMGEVGRGPVSLAPGEREASPEIQIDARPAMLDWD